jgi:hypothetical protein
MKLALLALFHKSEGHKSMPVTIKNQIDPALLKTVNEQGALRPSFNLR